MAVGSFTSPPPQPPEQAPTLSWLEDTSCDFCERLWAALHQKKITRQQFSDFLTKGHDYDGWQEDLSHVLRYSQRQVVEWSTEEIEAAAQAIGNEQRVSRRISPRADLWKWLSPARRQHLMTQARAGLIAASEIDKPL